MKKLLLTTIALVALCGAAKADVVYQSQLTIDHCTGPCGPAGTTFATLTITDTDAGMTFHIDPADGVAFNFNGNGFNTFNFNSTKVLTAADFLLPANYEAVIGVGNQDGFGTFGYAVDRVGQGTSTANLDFSVAGLNIEDLAKSVGGNPSVYFTIDVLGLNNNTGLIGSDLVQITTVAAVPEASTWMMMLLGFAGVGALGMRQSRKFRLA